MSNITPERRNHKWNREMKKLLHRDGTIAACIRCGCVKQYVNGKPTYFINDTSYDKSPNCLTTNQKDNL